MHISNNMSVSGGDAVRAASKATAPNGAASTQKMDGIQEPVDQLELSAEALAEIGRAHV